MTNIAEVAIRSAYRVVFRTVFANMDPEQAHHVAFTAIRVLPRIPILRGAAERYGRPTAADGITTMGIHFPSRFGLAAGFDKDAKGVIGLGLLGFGHVEVGTLTSKPQPGNDRPRLFRLVADRALVNRMGFNNHGAARAARRLERARRYPGRPVIGANIGKSRVVAVEDAVEDYLESTRMLAPFADYLAVNVSSPNTPGLRGLQEIDQLRPLLDAVKGSAGGIPVLVKIAPDLTDDQIDAIAGLAVELGLAGVIATNTTIERSGLVASESEVAEMGAGGLSGAPLAGRALDVLRRVRRTVPAEMCVIAVGGVTTEADVQARIEAGATLVQGYTAFLYEGPTWAMRINRLRKRRLRRAARRG